MTAIETTAGGLAFVRTPDARFDGLDDFPYEPRYVDVDGLRMAYVDAGAADAPPVRSCMVNPPGGICTDG
jgi:haloalkane dehalogenase